MRLCRPSRAGYHRLRTSQHFGRQCRPQRSRGALALLLPKSRPVRHLWRHLHPQRRPPWYGRGAQSGLRGCPLATMPVPPPAKRPGLRPKDRPARRCCSRHPQRLPLRQLATWLEENLPQGFTVFAFLCSRGVEARGVEPLS
jgi:hypothetical protein